MDYETKQKVRDARLRLLPSVQVTAIIKVKWRIIGPNITGESLIVALPSMYCAASFLNVTYEFRR